MTTFVVRNDIQIFLGKNERTFHANENLVQGLIKAVLRDSVQVPTRRQQRGLVDQVRQIRADHTRSGTSNGYQIDILRHWHVTAVNFENRQATIPVGALYCDTTVEAARSQQG